MTATINSDLHYRVPDAISPFCTGRRPKPEIVASKEQQIQRDDPGTSTQSSNQSDNSRLSRKALPGLGGQGGRARGAGLVLGSESALGKARLGGL